MRAVYGTNYCQIAAYKRAHSDVDRVYESKKDHYLVAGNRSELLAQHCNNEHRVQALFLFV